MDEKITLDLNSFKALASETRVHILKKLGERRATASELSTSLAISVQAASEHLEKMRIAGLVARVSREEAPPHKWVYYELTDKGRALLQPESTKKIWILLGTSILAIVAGFSRFLFDVFTPKAALAQSAFAPAGQIQNAGQQVSGGVQEIAKATEPVFKAVADQIAATASPFFEALAPSPAAPLPAGTETNILEIASVTANATTASVAPSAQASIQTSLQASAQPAVQLAQDGMQASHAAQAGGIALNSFELLLIILGALSLGASVMLYARARKRKAL